jgi:hypothetical protein
MDGCEMNDGWKRLKEEVVVSCFKVLSWHSLAGREENNEILQSG